MGPGKLVIVGMSICVLAAVWWYRARGGHLSRLGPWWLLFLGIGLCIGGVVMLANGK